MMKTAFAYWDDRIAPVFDTARRIHIVEADSGKIVAETGEVLADAMPVQKVLRLVELGVGDRGKVSRTGPVGWADPCGGRRHLPVSGMRASRTARTRSPLRSAEMPEVRERDDQGIE